MSNVEPILPKPILPKQISANWKDLYLPIEFRETFDRKIIAPIQNGRRLNDYSVILFGPPGTGKTIIPKAIAKELKWSLYDLGPQTFVNGSESIESSINRCFKEIRERVELDYETNLYIKTQARKPTDEPVRSQLVFVFDEIDELVVSRESNVDRETRFATTLMLPLFNELRKTAEDFGALIFVLTNHIERFDPAIKRPGRFDMIIPVGPPDRQARFLYFEQTLEKFRNEYRQNNVDIRYLPIRYPPGVLVERLDFDVLARASRRLGFGEIKNICRDVIEQKILMQPHSIDKIRKLTSKVLIALNTNDFTDWIIKYRNLSADVQAEIERFYKDFSSYQRGAIPYLDPNNIHDRINQEFSSLNLKHNIELLKYKIINREWKVNKSEILYVVLRNLAELNTFNGKFSVMVRGCGINIKEIEPCRIVAGKRSGGIIISLKPTTAGKLQIQITVQGSFDVKGIGQKLKGKHAELRGTVKEAHTIVL